jgi:uncharacterized membrane protein YeaQ/YmgE (transglycosylase-associated protein family)
MTFFSFLFFQFVASITGAIGAKIAGRKNMGCLASIALGFIGALIGIFIADKLDLPLFPLLRIGGHSFPLIWSVVGAALFIALLNLLSPSRR